MGVGHTVGALVQTVPRYAAEWFSWALWATPNDDLGLPLILIGLTVLWLGHRAIAPPPFIAWTLAAWTVVGEVLSGPSPLLLLLLAAALLLVAARRARRGDNPALPADTTPSPGMPAA